MRSPDGAGGFCGRLRRRVQDYPVPSKGKIVILAGPTAVGKTSASLALAEAFDAEIISADAVAVFRGLDIGSAKPSREERDRVPHHMIDVADPDEPYDANRFGRQARAAADALLARGKRVLVAGGTGLYIKAMVHGLFSQGRSDPELRASLRAEAEQLGAPALHRKLAGVDPQSAARIHPNDAYRIIRALEVCILTGRPASAAQAAHGFSEAAYDALVICLHREREELYARIDLRVDQMMAEGLEDEVRGLLDRGYGPDLKSMQSIGYRHVHQLISGRLSREEAVSTLKRDTRRLAKRQLTWFRADPEVLWISPGDAPAMHRAAARHLE